MSDAMLERFEAIVRENEMLRGQLEDARGEQRHLALGLGHAVMLINLAKTVIRLRDGQTPVEEAHHVMFDIVTRWEQAK